tara:strand:+ start:158 stop:1141 length:984 start_codon:yes stop_codon:yes gene_type:complete
MEQIDDSETESIGAELTNTVGVATTSAAINLESWPLTGIPADEVGNWPILVVKIDNHDRARPQYGLNAADVVFEEIVEGGLTRLAALYHSKEADMVGPIRSVRTSDFNLLQNLNRPLFANSGGNEDVLQLLQEINFVDVSSNAARGVYRRLDERPSPHDLVSNTKSLRNVGADRGQGGIPPIMFERSDGNNQSQTSGIPIKGVDLDYGSTLVQYRWEQDRSGWLRTQNGSSHADANGLQIAPEVLVIQVVSYTRSAADGRSPEAVLVGTGRALLLFEGVLIEGTWERSGPTDVTRYFDRDGNAVLFPRGSAWIALPRVGQTQVIENE